MTQVSVVVPTFGRPELLDRLLRSIAAQTFTDLDVVVVDDASPERDRYEAVIAAHAGALRLQYLRNPENRGAQHARNRGVSASTGALVAFVDDDDEWLPRKLERQVAAFAAAPPGLGLSYTWADAVDAGGAVVHRYRDRLRGRVLEALLDRCFIPSPTVVVRRAAIASIGGFDLSLPSCQDWDAWTRIVAAGFEVGVVEEVLALNHKHGGPSIGTSPRSRDGFRRFYAKHEALYRGAGLTRNLSEKYRGLAYSAMVAGDRALSRELLRSALRLWRGNPKAWLRLAQVVAGSRP